MGVKVKHNGAWVEPKKIYAKVGGVWKEGKLNVKQGGSWQYVRISRHITQPDSGSGTTKDPYLFYMSVGDSIDWQPRVNGATPEFGAEIHLPPGVKAIKNVGIQGTVSSAFADLGILYARFRQRPAPVFMYFMIMYRE